MIDTRDSQSRMAGVSIEGHGYSRVVALRNLNLSVILIMMFILDRSYAVYPIKVVCIVLSGLLDLRKDHNKINALKWKRIGWDFHDIWEHRVEDLKVLPLFLNNCCNLSGHDTFDYDTTTPFSWGNYESLFDWGSNANGIIAMDNSMIPVGQQHAPTSNLSGDFVSHLDNTDIHVVIHREAHIPKVEDTHLVITISPTHYKLRINWKTSLTVPSLMVESINQYHKRGVGNDSMVCVRSVRGNDYGRLVVRIILGIITCGDVRLTIHEGLHLHGGTEIIVGIIATTLYWDLNEKILLTCSTHDNTSPDINPSTNNNDNGEHIDVEIGQVVRSCSTEKERPPYHSANVMHRNWKSLIPLYTTLLHGEEITVPYSSLVACHNNIFDDMGYETEFTTSRDNDEDSQRTIVYLEYIKRCAF